MNFFPKGWQAAGVLMALAVASAMLLSGVDQLTHTRIARNQQIKLQTRLNELIPADSYDNDLLQDSIRVSDPKLGPETGLLVWRARKAGHPVAIAMTLVAPDGYSGPIRLLLAINSQGSLMGVRTLEHHETPGLGDDIELKRSDWTLSFDGKSLDNTESTDWTVRRDGGIFDQFSGATITPRAVVLAVHRALLYFQSERETLFARPSEGR